MKEGRGAQFLIWNKYRIVIKKNKYNLLFVLLLFLVLVGIFSHQDWFNLGSVISYADFRYQFEETAQELSHSNVWIANSNFGSINIQPYKFLFNIVQSLMIKIGLSFSIAIKVTHLIPITLLGLISPYILMKHLTKNDFVSFVGAIFYGSSTPFIIRQSQGHLSVAFVVALAPLLLYFFIKAVKNNKLRSWLVFIFFYWVGSCYEIRMIYIATFLFIGYFIFFKIKDWRRYIFNFFITGVVFLSLSSFFLIPLLVGGFHDNINAVASRSLFGNSHYSLLRSFSLSHFEWNGSNPIAFQDQPIMWYFWVAPLVAFTVFLYPQKKRKYKKEVLFFGIVSLIGIFLTKQVDAPFPGAFQWLRENFPGFILFRSGSKFYFILMLGYLGLICYSLLQIKQISIKIGKKYKYCMYPFLLLIIMLVSFANLQPLFSKKIDRTFSNRKIPQDYFILKDFILKQSDYFRIFWVPQHSNWGIYTNNHPKISNNRVTKGKWKNFLERHNKVPIQEELFSVFEKSFSDNLFDISSIKYVVVSVDELDNNHDPFYYFGRKKNPNIRSWYINKLDGVDFLKKIDIGAKELIVYENLNYKPHIFSLDKVYSFDSMRLLEQKYNFLKNQLNEKFNFIVNSDKNDEKFNILSRLFEDLSVKSGKRNSFLDNKTALLGNNNISIYANKKKDTLYYSVKNNEIFFYTKENGELLLNGEKINFQNDEKEIVSKKVLDPAKEYYLNNNNVYSLLNQQGGEQKLGLVGESSLIELCSVGDNFIKNASFQDGLWGENVGDCHRYDDNPILDMKLKTYAENSEQYLQLEATRHMACAVKKIEIKKGGRHLFGFDYRGVDAENAGYHLSFDDENGTVIKNKFNLDSQGWNHFEEVVNVPVGSELAKLHVYAYETDKLKNNIVGYDNFFLKKIISEERVEKQERERGFDKIQIALSDKEKVFEYYNNKDQYENVIENHSFEEGLWQEKVGNCHRYDENPVLAMKINKAKRTDGTQSLQLEATRHTACSKKTFPINEKKNYLFSFDYQGENSKKAGYYIKFNDKEKTVINEKIEIEGDNKWNRFEKEIKTPTGATKASLHVYAYESDKKENNIVRYDNFSLTQLPDLEDKYYVVEKAQVDLKNPKKIEFRTVNPTKKTVYVKGAETGFFLVMNESYHKQWCLNLADRDSKKSLRKWFPFKKANETKKVNHYKLNDFLNAWYVDPVSLCRNSSGGECKKNADGSYDLEMKIEFWPQRWFYFGLTISSVTLIILFGYLIGTYFKSKKYER